VLTAGDPGGVVPVAVGSENSITDAPVIEIVDEAAVDVSVLLNTP